jgi:hypothetical protein
MEKEVIKIANQEFEPLAKAVRNRIRFIVAAAVERDNLLSFEIDFSYIKESLWKVHAWFQNGNPFQVIKNFTKEGHDLKVYLMPEGWKAQFEAKRIIRNDQLRWLNIVTEESLSKCVEDPIILQFHPEGEQSSADLIFDYLISLQKLGKKATDETAVSNFQIWFLYNKGIWESEKKNESKDRTEESRRNIERIDE